ncbi:MAG: hypothetical protein P0Y53_16970 [Candidatus Pseudobacter hemicellulosilyticus]|uniref:Uncharacterized protein n=1 Tax=Candidatus Pseudobacter hemicellulosilyticus TaxID=3121375 RepID=A0AAJ5WP52_9BACT|nr:MAG: hypothetical protein P0Y53_16970 [Pseudobacter sp.]
MRGHCLTIGLLLWLVSSPGSLLAQQALPAVARSGTGLLPEKKLSKESPLLAEQVTLKQEYAHTLLQLSDALLARQLTDPKVTDCGAIQCQHCNVLHTRAAEAVYPFAVAYTITGHKKYLQGAKQAAAWLLRQQQPDGSWKETPEEWTGTTTDQLLMLLLTSKELSGQLTATEKRSWTSAMQKAADYLNKVMTPEFASINYVATTTATLALAGEVLQQPVYSRKARVLAHRTIGKMDEQGFLQGEGGRTHRNKLGVDLGYNMEMSLWGLGLYAKTTGDSLVWNTVKKAMASHLPFIYPDGSLDASWGIRSNKWTLYGSATSDGSNVILSLLADTDKRYASASWKLLQFLRSNILPEGLIGYGPQHAEVLKGPPCVYPTFTKAKNLALAYVLEQAATREIVPLPTEQTGWMQYYPTLDVVQVRTTNFMATITGYRYKDYAAGAKSKYMHRPNGGAQSYLWVKDHGVLQASSPTEYSRPEPMSFPEAPGVLSLTPRIEYRDTAGYFTNLYEFDSRISTASEVKKWGTNQGQAGTGVTGRDSGFVINVAGELKDKHWMAGGVGYGITYRYSDEAIEKTVSLTWHDAWPMVRIIEPFVQRKGMTIQQMDPRTVLITGGGRNFRVKIVSGNAELRCGEDAGHFWAPYPALKAYPISIQLQPPAEGAQASISYRIEIIP